MNTLSIGGRLVASAAGCLCIIGALRVLGVKYEDTSTSDWSWLHKNSLMIITLAVTILTGHLAECARRAAHRPGLIGFAFLAMAGTALTVYASVGKQAETTYISVAEADMNAEAREIAKGGIASSHKMLARSHADLASECKSGAGKRCKGIKETIAVYEAAVRGHQSDLQRLGPVKVVAADAERFAELAAIFGFDQSRVKAGAILMVPFLSTLFLEFGTIICLGFAFRHRPDAVSVRPSMISDVSDADLANVRAAFEGKDASATIVPFPQAVETPSKKEEVLLGILADLEAGLGYRSQTEICDRHAVKRSTLSDWISVWERESVIPDRRTVGRCKELTA